MSAACICAPRPCFYGEGRIVSGQTPVVPVFSLGRMRAMGGLSIWHWIIVGAVVFILFGGKFKISDVMGDVAKGIKAFKKGMSEDESRPMTQKSRSKARPASAALWRATSRRTARKSSVDTLPSRGRVALKARGGVKAPLHLAVVTPPRSASRFDPPPQGEGAGRPSNTNVRSRTRQAHRHRHRRAYCNSLEGFAARFAFAWAVFRKNAPHGCGISGTIHGGDARGRAR